jgi:putative addiction module CopG family antidote
MNVTIHRSLAAFVDQRIQFGRYATPQEVVQAALCAFQSQQDASDTGLTGLRATIQAGLDEADCGAVEGWDADERRAEGQRLLKESLKKGDLMPRIKRTRHAKIDVAPTPQNIAEDHFSGAESWLSYCIHPPARRHFIRTRRIVPAHRCFGAVT